MEPFCDFAFYKESYLYGRDEVIPEKDFIFYAHKATDVIESAVNPNIGLSIDDTVKKMTCEIAEIIYERDNGRKGADGETIGVGVASEKVGDYSVSYASNTPKEVFDLSERRIRRLILSVLGPRGVLFKGVL